MEPKYKIGDTVTIKKVRTGNCDDYRCWFTNIMVNDYGGRSFKIKNIRESSRSSSKILDDGHIYTLEGIGFNWASSMFEDKSPVLYTGNDSLKPFIRKRRHPELDFHL